MAARRHSCRAAPAAAGWRTCPLGAIGHPKDGVRRRLQIVYGLLTSKDGIPVAIEVFASNTGDPATVAAQVTKVKDRSRLPSRRLRHRGRLHVFPAYLVSTVLARCWHCWSAKGRACSRSATCTS